LEEVGTLIQGVHMIVLQPSKSQLLFVEADDTAKRIPRYVIPLLWIGASILIGLVAPWCVWLILG
jgi:hypothetical protein